MSSIEERRKAEAERDRQEEIRRKIEREIKESISAFENGTKTRTDIETQIADYEREYNFDGRDEVIKKLDRIEAIKRNIEKNSKKGPTKLIYVIAVVFLIGLLALLVPQLTKSAQIQRNEQQPEAHQRTKEKEDEYTTYYIDENGNGKLDRGEGNYTTNENGDVVDWDDDKNNFE